MNLSSLSIYFLLYIYFGDINFIALTLYLSICIIIDVVNHFSFNKICYFKNIGKLMYFFLSNMNKSKVKYIPWTNQMIQQYFQENNFHITSKIELERCLVKEVLDSQSNNKQYKLYSKFINSFQIFIFKSVWLYSEI